MKITKLDESFQIDVKRLYLPFVIEDDCPVCGRSCKYDLTHEYLSYPVLGDTISLGFYCGDDGHEWTKEVVLQVSILPVPTYPEEKQVPVPPSYRDDWRDGFPQDVVI